MINLGRFLLGGYRGSGDVNLIVITCRIFAVFPPYCYMLTYSENNERWVDFGVAGVAALA